MRQDFATGFVSSLESWKTWLTWVIWLALELSGLGETLQLAGTNAWDVLIPHLMGALELSMLGAGWWLLQIVQVISFLGRNEALIRFGSPLRATLAMCFRMAGASAAMILGTFVLTAGILAGAGFPLDWSKGTIDSTQPYASVFSAEAFVRVFPSPILAVVSGFLFFALGILLFTAFVASITALQNRLLARAIAVSIYLWLVLSSFSNVTLPSFVDGALTISLGWVMGKPDGLIGWTFQLVAFLILTASFLSFRSFCVARLGKRATQLFALLGITLLALLASSHAARAGSTLNFLAHVFAAGHGDIVGFVLVAAVPLSIASLFNSDLQLAKEGFAFYEAFRRGSFRKWVLHRLLSGAGFMLGATTLFMLIVMVWANGVMGPLGVGDANAAIRAWLGLNLVGLILMCISATFAWASTVPTLAWVVIVAAYLFLGYWPLGADFVTPYGAGSDLSTSYLVLTADGLFLLVFVLFIGRLYRRSRMTE